LRKFLFLIFNSPKALPRCSCHQRRQEGDAVAARVTRDCAHEAAAPIVQRAASAAAAPARSAAAAQPAADQRTAALSREERFARDLYEHCKMVNPSLAMWLNGSFEVLQMDGDELVLGFQRKMPLEKVDTACRPMVEQQAAAILGREVRLTVKLIEGPSQPRREPRRGHLAEAAKAMGGQPVRKDS
jgi:hypothetical protein